MAVELTTFVGNWSDSLGNNVDVVEKSSGIQVTLAKSTGRGREIVLTVKKVGTTFVCGHYVLDEGESSHSKIVWRDNRFQDRLTVWHRRDEGPGRPDGAVPAPPPPPGAACGFTAAVQPKDWATPGVPVAGQPWQAQQGQAVAGSAPGPVPPVTAADVAKQLAQAHAAQAAQAANAQAAQQQLQMAQLAQVAQLAQASQMAATSQAVAQLAAAAQGGAPFRHVMPPPPAPPRSAGYTPGQLPPLSHFPAVPQFGVQMRPLVPPVPVRPAVLGANAGFPQRPPAPPAPPRAPVKQAVPESADWSHVLNVLTAVKKEPGETGGAEPITALPGSPHSDEEPANARLRDLPPPAQGEEARWSEVLDLLAAAATADTPAGSAVPQSAPMPAELFGVFGLPSSAPPAAPPSEAEREAVLAETLARLLREKHGLPQPAQESSMPESSLFDGTAGFSSAPWPSVAYGDEAIDVPDWQRQAQQAQQTAQLAPLQKMEGPLTKFIRIFGLDELAAECLRKLEDDEAAYVIESCQSRLKHAKNPSAVVMIAIKGVAAKVGRRYYGDKEASSLQMALAAAHGNKGGLNAPLQMFLGSPEKSPEEDAADDNYADADPYAVFNADEDGGEGEGAEAGVVAKHLTTEATDAVLPGEPDAKRRKASEATVVEDENDDEEDGDGDALFFVDTG